MPAGDFDSIIRALLRRENMDPGAEALMQGAPQSMQNMSRSLPSHYYGDPIYAANYPDDMKEGDQNADIRNMRPTDYIARQMGYAQKAIDNGDPEQSTYQRFNTKGPGKNKRRIED